MTLFLIFTIRPVQAIEFSKENLYQLATLAAQDGELEKAVDLYSKAIELDPKFLPAYNGLGIIYETSRLRDMNKAVHYFQLATAVVPDSVESWNNLGRSQYTKGDFVGAEKSLLHSLKVNPAQPDVEITLGWVYLLGQSRGEKAVEYFKRGLQEKDNDMVHYGLGLAYLVQEERFLILDAITALRKRGREDLALKLEGMMKNNVRSFSDIGMPLVTGTEPPRSVFHDQLEAAGGEGGVDADKSSEGIQVRLRGPLQR